MKKHLHLLLIFLWSASIYANDICSNAIQLNPTTDCNLTFGSFSGSGLDGAIPSCANQASQDVWYSFTATEQTMSIYIQRPNANSQMYYAFEIYEDSCTGNRFKCVVPSLNVVSYFNTDFVIGKTYFIRVINPTNSITTYGFNICVQAFPKPINDACANATELIPSANCTNTSGTFSGALLDGAIPSCANQASQDVWYRFTATEQTMSIYIQRPNANSQMYYAFEIYEDSCTGNLFKCIAPSLNVVSYFNTDFVIGKTYFIRVVNPSTSITTYGFNICVQAFPKPINDACANATELIPSANCTNTSGTFSGALLDGAIPSCANQASQDVWYRFTATEQTMSIYIQRPNANSQMYYAFEIYEDSCTGNRFKCIAPSLNAVNYSNNDFTIGRTYFIRVVNPSTSITTYGFNICLVGPPPANCTPSVAINATKTAICQGESITFEANPVNGGTSPAYQWKVNGNNTGTNSSSFTTSTLTNGSIVTCMMTSNAACAFPASVTSNSITIDVTTPTVPTFAPIGPICAGGTFTLPSNSDNGISGIWNPAINNTETTTYTFTPNTGQCAEAVTITVGVNLVNTQTSTQGNTITATAANATYQWINCSGNEPINNATDRSFTATSNGSYAVIVTQNGCSRTSNCVTISTLETEDYLKFDWKIYPNPANDQLFIELKEETAIVIADMLGKIIEYHNLKSGTNIINLSNLSSGMYIIKSDSGANAKLVKK